MRLIYVRDRSGQITAWGCNDDGQGVYSRPLNGWWFVERHAPPATPVFGSRWHFRRWITRHFGVRGVVVEHTGWPASRRQGTSGTPPATEDDKSMARIVE